MKQWLWNKILWLFEPFIGKDSDQILSVYYRKLSKEQKTDIWKYAGKQFRIFPKKTFKTHHKETLMRHYLKKVPFHDRNNK